MLYPVSVFAPPRIRHRRQTCNCPNRRAATRAKIRRSHVGQASWPVQGFIASSSVSLSSPDSIHAHSTQVSTKPATNPPCYSSTSPLSGVDPIARAGFWELIREMAAAGHTIFVGTHYMDEAENCGRIALMYSGKVIAPGALRANLDDKPRNSQNAWRRGL